MKKLPSLSLLLSLTAALFAPVAQAELTTNQLLDVNFAQGYTNGRIVDTNLGIYQGGWQQTSLTTNQGAFITNNPTQAFLPTTKTGQDIWHAFDNNTNVITKSNVGGYLQTKINFKVTEAFTNGDYFFHLSNLTNSTVSLIQRLFVKIDVLGSTNMFLGLSTSNTTVNATNIYGTNPLSLNKTYDAVIRWDFLPGTNDDTLRLYVDPTDPILTNNAVYHTYLWANEPTNVAAANLRVGGATTTPGVLVNTIQIHSVIPEPSTYAMLALAGAGFAGYVIRRRRR